MVGGGGGEAELGEDAGDVLLDRALGDDQALGDGGVAAALGHEGEDVELAADLADRPAEGMRLLKRMFREFESTAERVARENLLLEAFQREGAGLPQG